MRLIDADEFKKQIAGMAIINNYPADKVNKMCKLIDCQKTAYDVDKVVEELKQRSTDIAIIYQSDKEPDYEYADGIEINVAVGIIKSGGIEGCRQHFR